MQRLHIKRPGLLTADGRKIIHAPARQRRRRHSRSAHLRRLHHLSHLIGHGESHSHAHARRGIATAARILRRLLQCIGRLKLCIGIEIANHAHRCALIHRRLNLRRQRNVLDHQRHDLQSKRREIGLHAIADKLAQFILIGRQIERGNLALTQDVGKPRDHHVAQLIAQFIDRESPIGADELLEESARIGNFDPIASKRPQPHRPKLAVTQHDRILRPPLAPGERPGGNKIHLGLERRAESILPPPQGGEDGHVLRLQRVSARIINIRQPPLIHKRRHL